MSQFTPVSALLGGVLIGGAASLLLWLNGRVAGISGISRGLLRPQRGEILWRALFLLGLVLGAALWYLGSGSAPLTRAGFPAVWLVLSGLLVGFGTALGGGCTSGHGVCGLGRLSLRSLVATLVFLTAGILSAYVSRHLLGLQ